MAWERTFGAWHAVDGGWIRRSQADVVGLVVRLLGLRLTRELWAAGWPRSVLSAGGGPPMDLSVADVPGPDFLSRDQVVVRAECRALVLLHPNPLPRMRLFG